MIKIDVLVIGKLRREEGVILEAHSTSTLITVDDTKIVVDTSTKEMRELLLHSLDGLGTSPEDIDIVVNTHLHGDHTSNNELFRNARFLAHADECPGEGYEIVQGEMDILPGVRLIHTPGHSRGSMSVVVEADRRYVITGDAMPLEDNYRKWVPPGLHYDAGLALSSMRRIVDLADVIVPGHDAPFNPDR
jgi:N-acyl homoserine lactone hydrolase